MSQTDAERLLGSHCLWQPWARQLPMGPLCTKSTPFWMLSLSSFFSACSKQADQSGTQAADGSPEATWHMAASGTGALLHREQIFAHACAYEQTQSMTRQGRRYPAPTCSAWLSESLSGPSSESAVAPEESRDTCMHADTHI